MLEYIHIINENSKSHMHATLLFIVQLLLYCTFVFKYINVIFNKVYLMCTGQDF